ncbi:unnamed protein product [Cyprideis torosa]|uniref:Uncharacterized protein n=1 Tax=Cyprideis torosa TaxID=163714 RepID=A0A7R8ZL01_9CRUS|nr:unnamed protein product [Cyprideis torosa]CAG0892253.1 unnamed protein product [Cyprideis torosa]
MESREPEPSAPSTSSAPELATEPEMERPKKRKMHQLKPSGERRRKYKMLEAPLNTEGRELVLPMPPPETDEEDDNQPASATVDDIETDRFYSYLMSVDGGSKTRVVATSVVSRICRHAKCGVKMSNIIHGNTKVLMDVLSQMQTQAGTKAVYIDAISEYMDYLLHRKAITAELKMASRDLLRKVRKAFRKVIVHEQRSRKMAIKPDKNVQKLKALESSAYYSRAIGIFNPKSTPSKKKAKIVRNVILFELVRDSAQRPTGVSNMTMDEWDNRTKCGVNLSANDIRLISVTLTHQENPDEAESTAQLMTHSVDTARNLYRAHQKPRTAVQAAEMLRVLREKKEGKKDGKREGGGEESEEEKPQEKEPFDDEKESSDDDLLFPGDEEGGEEEGEEGREEGRELKSKSEPSLPKLLPDIRDNVPLDDEASAQYIVVDDENDEVVKSSAVIAVTTNDVAVPTDSVITHSAGTNCNMSGFRRLTSVGMSNSQIHSLTGVEKSLFVFLCEGVTPDGFGAFVSKVYIGKASDKYTVNHSKVLEILEAGVVSWWTKDS